MLEDEFDEALRMGSGFFYENPFSDIEFFVDGRHEFTAYSHEEFVKSMEAWHYI
jgi:hypothetical protein